MEPFFIYVNIYNTIQLTLKLKSCLQLYISLEITEQFLTINIGKTITFLHFKKSRDVFNVA